MPKYLSEVGDCFKKLYFKTLKTHKMYRKSILHSEQLLNTKPFYSLCAF